MDCTSICRSLIHATELLSAISCETFEVVQHLFKNHCAGAPTILDECGRNALHVAASYGSVEVIEWLIEEYGVDLGIQDAESSWTGLHRALFYGQVRSAATLIKHGGSLFDVDKEDLTPLDLVTLDRYSTGYWNKDIGVLAKVLHDYSPDEGDEEYLSLRKGEVICRIIEVDEMYWFGELRHHTGLFPSNCVQIIVNTRPGKVVSTWGTNSNYTLGHKDGNVSQCPEPVETFWKEQKIYIHEVVMSKFHSVFLSEDGLVYTCGHGRGGRLGHGNEKTQLLPLLVEGLKEVKCTAIAVGENHTVVLTQDGSVFTFGLNDSHQLGHSPPPSQCLQPKQVVLKQLKGKPIIGIAAGPYHTVMFTSSELFTCGLNDGQLGHPKGDRTQIIPRQASGLHDKDVRIGQVSCCEAATVCATTLGDVYLLHQHTCIRIIKRFKDLKSLVISGSVSSNKDKTHRMSSNLKVFLLSNKGTVFRWLFEDRQTRECNWLTKRPLKVSSIALGRKLLVVTDYGEVFFCEEVPTTDSSLPNRLNRTSSQTSLAQSSTTLPCTRSRSLSGTTSKTSLAQSPPNSSPLSDMRCAPSTGWQTVSPSTGGVKFAEKVDCVSMDVERIAQCHQAVHVITDPMMRNFAILHEDPNCCQTFLPDVGPSQLSYHLGVLLDEADTYDNVHDILIEVGGNLIAVHKFILASRSESFYNLILDPKTSHSGPPVVKLKGVDLTAVLEILRFLYTGSCATLESTVPVSALPSLLRDNCASSTDGESISSNLEEDLEWDSFAVSTEELDNLDTPRTLKDLEVEATLFQAFQKPQKQKNRKKKSNNKNNKNPSNVFNDVEIVSKRINLEDIALPKNVKNLLTAARNCHIPELELRITDIYLGMGLKLAMMPMSFNRHNLKGLCDIAILSEDDKKFFCHKCILVARLEYFSSMLASDWMESTSKFTTLRMPIPSEVLEVLLEFLYTDNALTVNHSQDIDFLSDVLAVADQLLVERLKEMCEVKITTLLSHKNVADVLEMACIYNSPQLKHSALQYICHNFSSILEIGAIDSLSEDILQEVSASYKEMFPNVGCRTLPPLDAHVHLLKKASPVRKSRIVKSSYSESDADNYIIQDFDLQRGNSPEDDRTSDVTSNGKENDLELHDDDDEEQSITSSPLADKEDDDLLHCNNNEDYKPLETQAESEGSSETIDQGQWYKKAENIQIPKSTKKRNRSTETPAAKPVTPQTDPKPIKTEQKPAWGPSSPPTPSLDLKSIMEEEQKHKLTPGERKGNSASKSPSKSPQQKYPQQKYQSSHNKQKLQNGCTKSHWKSQEDISGESAHAVKWDSGRRLSQKEKKQARTKAQKPSTEEKTPDDSKPVNPWSMKTQPEKSPVKSFKELQEEEQGSINVKPKSSQKTNKKPNNSNHGKQQQSSRVDGSRTAQKRLRWGLLQEGGGSDSFALTGTNDVTIKKEESERKPAWQGMASSPPSSGMKFAEILESQEEEKKGLMKALKKPLNLIQIEDKAIEELFAYYNGGNNPCECIVVQRAHAARASPVWHKKRAKSES